MTSVTAAARWGWRIHVVLSALLVLNGLGLFLFIVDTHAERTIGLLLTAFAAFGLVAQLLARPTPTVVRP